MVLLGYISQRQMWVVVKALTNIAMLSFFLNNAYAQSNEQIEIQARWHVNYGHYLIEVGKYLEALEYFDTAFDLSTKSMIAIDALSARANLLALYLDSKEQALATYQYIENNYPEKKQLSLYRQGLLLYEMKRFQSSESILKKYLQQYPYGKFRYQAEAILQKSKSKIVPPKYQISKIPFVRIRLCRNVQNILIYSDIGDNICLANGICQTKFILKVASQVLFVNENAVNTNEIVLNSQSPIRVVSGKYDKTVRGSLKIELQNGKLTAINIIDIESYLQSVVPSESYPTWPLETLKAQAIAARTYALYQIEHRKNWSYDMVDNEGDQVYGGVNREHSRCTYAVQQTKGRVLIKNDLPILAMYSANSGGFTASAKAIFNLPNKPYLIAQKDLHSLKGKMAYWQRSFTEYQIETSLDKIGIFVNGINKISASSFGPSGRVIRVKIEDRNGSRIFRTRTTLKRALELPEILFRIKKSGAKFIFDGHGYGHGVGYSQWGGAVMGERLLCEKILSFYYPGVKVVNKW